MRFIDVDVITAAAMLPVTVEGFIEHGRLNGLTVERQPELLARQLAAATERAELYTRRSLITQTLSAVFVLDGLNCACAQMLALPRGRVQSVASITSAGAVLDPTGYFLNGPILTLAAPLAAPATVVYVSGYGDEAEDVPALIVEGIYRYATSLYENRTGQSDTKFVADAGRTLPAGVIDCWRPYQIEVSG